MKRWTVRDVMTHKVVWVTEEAGYREILTKLAEHRISAVPVLDAARRVVGVVSEADLLRKLELGDDERVFLRPSRRAAKAKSAADRASELMTRPPIVIEATASLVEAAKALAGHDVKRLPVVDPDGRLLGIVSRADLLKAYLRTDTEIREEIRQEVLRDNLWIDPDSLSVEVLHGEVRLRGQVDTKTTAMLVVQMCALVPGVVEVHNELDWGLDDTEMARSGYFRSHPFSTELKNHP